MLKKLKYSNKLLNTGKVNYLLLFFIILIFGQIFSIFLPFLKGNVLIVNDYINIPIETKLGEKYYNNIEFMKSIHQKDSHIDSKLAKDFFSANRHELGWQAQCGWLMHHQSALLSPINQLFLGKKMSEISQQYGSLTMIALKFLLKASGGVTFENYLRVLYSFYPIYYLLFFLISFYLLKDFKYFFLVVMISAGFLFKLSYTNMYLAPGFNPIRQIFPLSVLFFLALYLQKKKISFFVLMLTLSILTVLNNREFGVFVFGALFVVILAKNFIEKKPVNKKEIVFVITAVLISIYLCFFGRLGRNPLEKYYLAGISGPLIDGATLKFILIIFSLIYLIIYKLLCRKGELKYVAIFLFFYIQGILTYYIWNPVPNHFFSIVTPITLLFVILLKLTFDGLRTNIYKKLAIVSIVLCVFLFLYLPFLREYNKDKAIYQKIADNHKIYSWDLPTARIKSTMNPEYFVNGVNLIQKYSKNKNSIYIISQYDNFLPFLAQKYSAMPFDEVAISLLTSQETNDCISRILNDKPEYIFVDTGIEEGIYDKEMNKILAYLSAHYDFSTKIKMWGELKKVYLGIKDSYQLVEKSDIISIYKKQ